MSCREHNAWLLAPPSPLCHRTPFPPRPRASALLAVTLLACSYISSVWNVIDVLNLSLFVVFFFYRFYFVALTALLDFRPEPHVFSEFRYMAELAYQSQNLTAFNCVLTYMKMFK